MGMSITETVYLSLYLSLVAKKKQKQRKKVQSWEKEKLHMPYEGKSVLKM